MTSVDYNQSNANDTLFIKRSGEKVTILIVYVDDIVVIRNDSIEIDHLKGFLGNEFEIKGLGKLRYFLGIEITRSSKGIFLYQRKYILNLLFEIGMLGCHPSDIPMEASNHLKEKEGEPVDKGRYQQLIGKLIYLSHTRSDIVVAERILSLGAAKS
ncbi:uncharacterized mitochondrial protein AtMg00810-like [Macadamia integrifolia]|uniref:uncharacterized mitochondrial protein AtMg00810-like n=1 Tax=Macadamia integrifolia TaxID=60698 RepID=UPI001C4EED24|nr:uncharacterized mitochondrial protein AtMg00810-like [Macadamia integrifolia]